MVKPICLLVRYWSSKWHTRVRTYYKQRSGPDRNPRWRSSGPKPTPGHSSWSKDPPKAFKRAKSQVTSPQGQFKNVKFYLFCFPISRPPGRRTAFSALISTHQMKPPPRHWLPSACWPCQPAKHSSKTSIAWILSSMIFSG